MNLNFTNGNGVQRAACEKVARSLLNLPFDAIPLSLTITFVADPDPSQHNEFAITEYTYGSTSAKVEIASIAPAWPNPWKGIRFLQEVFAHELGHALFAALGTTFRTKIAQMFGASTDDIDELQPPGSKWENRIMEGIAETFKDAFLPRSFRRYANRTNRHIPINRYPEFRQLFREAVAGASVFDQMQTIPTLDIYDTLENPVSTPPYEEWPPLPDLGRVWKGTGISTIGYTVPANNGEPRRVSALYTDQEFGGRFGVMVRKWNTWELDDPVPGDRAGQYFVYACASPEGGGRGYRLVATQERSQLVPKPDLFKVELELWQGGVLVDELFQKQFIQVASFIIDDSRRDFGLSFIDGDIGIWVPNSINAPGSQKIGEVHDTTFTEGFVGLGVRREILPPPLGGNPSAFPQIGRLRAGPIFAEPFTLPTPGLTPVGQRAGARRKNRLISGGRG